MFETKTVTLPAELRAEDGDGTLSAVFSTFDVVDSDGDIVTRDAFTDGQEVPMVWSHDWTMPIGKGVIKVEPDRAVFKGKLWLDTDDGTQAYRKIKNAGSLQEYSWGFRILDAEPGERDGVPVRLITKAEVFEVSPVLVGANRETYTLAIKGRRRISRGQIEGAIAVLTALLGDDAEEEPAATAGEDTPPPDAGKGDEPPPGDAAPKGLDARLGALLPTLADWPSDLRTASDAELAAARCRLDELRTTLGIVRGAVEAGLARTEALDRVDVPTLLSEFQRLDGLYGPVQDGRRAG